MTDDHEPHSWLPFTSSEVQTALSVFGCVAAVLALAEVGRDAILAMVATRRVGKDCMVSFEGRQYSVPFHLLGQNVEIRGCAGVV